nr:hypothetical protein [Lachnospiraceae bacterium]
TVVKASEGYENDTVGLGYYTIDGSETSAETYEESLRESILQKLRDGKAAPEAFADLTEDAAALHVSKLEHIYLDGKEMLYDENDSEYAYYGLITDEYKYAYYDYDADSYMMFMDCGLVADYTGSPVLVNAEYVHALGGTYEIMTMPQEERSLDLRSGWVIGDHTWEVTGHYESGTYQNLKVTRDGTDLQITAYEGENYKVISVTAADFCKLFDLTYTVDEEEKAIYFTSQQAAADL